MLFLFFRLYPPRTHPVEEATSGENGWCDGATIRTNSPDAISEERHLRTSLQYVGGRRTASLHVAVPAWFRRCSLCWHGSGCLEKIEALLNEGNRPVF